MQKLQIMSTSQMHFCTSIKCQNVQGGKNEKVSPSTTHTGIKPGHRKCGLNVGLEGPFDSFHDQDILS